MNEELEELNMDDWIEEEHIARTHSFKKGDKVRFHRYDKWRDGFGIERFDFERNYSYDDVFEITQCYDEEDIVEIEPSPIGYTFLGEHLYLVKTEHLPEDLFTL